MPLPESVVQQMGREVSTTPGWSMGVVSFSGGIFLIALFTWIGLAYGYKPYIDGQALNVQNQIATLNQSISPTDQTNLINFYSQLANIQTLLAGRTPIADVFSWLETNTEFNIYYSQFAYTQGGQVGLTAEAKTQADAERQIAIFESSPQVLSFTTTGISFETNGTNGTWQFVATIMLSPSVFTAASTAGTTTAAATSTP